MKKYPEYDNVRQCLRQIEEKLKWGSSAKWHNNVFIELSEKIQLETDVVLSPTTLKRVWGKVKYDSAPSISTLNTLSQFAGYNNWRDFKLRTISETSDEIEKKISSNLGVIITSAAILTLIFLSLYAMIGLENKARVETDFRDVQFSSRPVTMGLPNSVVFDFDLNDIESDSLYIQQFWDVTKTIKLKPGQRQATGIYYYPGHFVASLLIDGHPVAEHDLFIESNGWMGTVDYEPIPKYVDSARLLTGTLSFPSAIIDEIKSSEAPLYSSFHCVQDFGEVSGDDIRIATTIRNVYNDKWAVCQTVKIVILGTEGAMIIPFSIPGCISELGLLLNDVYKSGKEHDLSAFGADFSDFRTVKIVIEEKKVKIHLDDREIYADQYHKSIGNIVGLRYRFLGAGEVGDLTIGRAFSEKDVMKTNFGY